MVKRVIKDERKNRNLKPNKIIIISCEGKTEKEYFSRFNGVDRNYRILFAKGDQTDSIHLVKNLSNFINKNNYKNFDDLSAYCVFDIDTFKYKEKNNLEAIELCINNDIVPITSTPCIELWFLLHFEKVMSFIDSKKVIEKLKKHITNYDKGMDVFNRLKPFINNAIKNAKLLEEYQKKNDNVIGTINANPNTEVYKLVEVLNKN